MKTDTGRETGRETVADALGAATPRVAETPPPAFYKFIRKNDPSRGVMLEPAPVTKEDEEEKLAAWREGLARQIDLAVINLAERLMIETGVNAEEAMRDSVDLRTRGENYLTERTEARKKSAEVEAPISASVEE